MQFAMTYKVAFLVYIVIIGTKLTSSLDCNSTKIDLVIVLDSFSGSRTVFDRYKNVFMDLVNESSFGNERTHMALILYNNSRSFVKHNFGQNQTAEAINKTLSELSFDESKMVSPSSASNLGFEELIKGRWDAMKVIVIMTDDNANETWVSLVEASKKLRKSMAQIFVVSLGNETNETNMKLLVGNGNLITKGNLESFKNEMKILMNGCTNQKSSSGSLPQQIVTKSVPATTVSSPIKCPTVPIVRPVVLSFKCPPPPPCPSTAPVISPVVLSFKCPPPAPCPTQKCPSTAACSLSTKEAKILASEGLCPCAGQKNFIIQQQQSNPPLAPAITSLPGDASSFLQTHSTITSSALQSHSSNANAAILSPSTIASSTFQSHSRMDSSSIGSTTHSTTSNSPAAHSIIINANTTAGSAQPATSRTAVFISTSLTKAPSNSTTASTSVGITNFTHTQRSQPATANLIAVESLATTATSSQGSSHSTTTRIVKLNSSPGPPSARPPLANGSISEVLSSTINSRTTLHKQTNSGQFSTTSAIKLVTNQTQEVHSESTFFTIQSCDDANILFVIDASGNHEQVFIEQIATIIDIIDDLEIDSNHHQVALLLHGSRKKQIVQFSFGAYDSAEKFKSAVKTLPFFPGPSSSGTTLKLVQNLLLDRRPNVLTIILYFTDGLSTADATATAEKLRFESLVTIYAIGISVPVSRSELVRLAGSDSRVFIRSDLQRLKHQLFGEILNCSSSQRLTIRQSSTLLPTTNSNFASSAQLKPNDSISPTTGRVSVTENAIKSVPQSLSPVPFNFPVVFRNQPFEEAPLQGNLLTTLPAKSLSTITSPAATTVTVGSPSKTVGLATSSATLVEIRNQTGITENIPNIVTNTKTITSDAEKEKSLNNNAATPSVIINRTTIVPETIAPFGFSSSLLPTKVSATISTSFSPPAVHSISVSRFINKVTSTTSTTTTLGPTAPQQLLTTSSVVNEPVSFSTVPKFPTVLQPIENSSISVATVLQPLATASQLNSPITQTNLEPDRKQLPDTLSSLDSVDPNPTNSAAVIESIDNNENRPLAEKDLKTKIVSNIVIKNCFLDLMFIVDASGSVGNVFQKELKLSADIVDRLILGPNHARISMITFAGPGKSKVIFPFDKFNTTEDIKSAILSASFTSGTTYTNEALDTAKDEYSRNGGRTGVAPFICILFTDGYANVDTTESSRKLRNSGATIFAVAFDKDEPINKSELVSITGSVSKVFTDETMNIFHDLFDKIERSCKTGSSLSIDI